MGGGKSERKLSLFLVTQLDYIATNPLVALFYG